MRLMVNIYQRPIGDYVNATDLCKAARKKLNDYTRLNTTKDFLSKLSLVAGIPVTEQKQGVMPFVFTIQGGTPESQGTWIHPDVAINLAQWLSPKFTVRVSRIINE